MFGRKAMGTKLEQGTEYNCTETKEYIEGLKLKSNMTKYID